MKFGIKSLQIVRVFWAFHEIRRREGLAFLTGADESFGIKKKCLGKIPFGPYYVCGVLHLQGNGVLLYWVTLKLKAQRAFETSGTASLTTHSVTRRSTCIFYRTSPRTYHVTSPLLANFFFLGGGGVSLYFFTIPVREFLSVEARRVEI